MLRRMHRVQIGKRRELLVGEAVGKFVQKTYHTARQCALVIIRGLAFRAGAVGIVSVVLAHRYHILTGVGFEYRIYALGHRFKYLFIRQAPLRCLARMALSAEICVVLRMFFPVHCRWQQLIERMHPQSAGKFILRFLQSHPFAVHRVCGKRIVLRLTVTECRILHHIYIWQFHLSLHRHCIFILAPVIATEITLKYRYGAIQAA